MAVAIGAADLGGFQTVRAPLSDRYCDQNAEATQADRAWLIRWAILYGSIAAIAGGWLVVLNRFYALIGFGVIGAALLVYHWWLVDRRQEMSVTGELAGIFRLAMGAPWPLHGQRPTRWDGVGFVER